MSTSVNDLLAAGRIAEAENALRDQIERDGDDVDAIRVLARILLHTGRPDEGFERLAAACRTHSGHAGLHYECGVLALACGRTSDAVSALRRELDVSPGHPDALFNLGWALRRQAKPAEAAACFERAAAARPDWGAAWYNLGNCRLDCGAPAEAAMAHRRALATGGPALDGRANLAFALWRLGQDAEAEDLLEQVLAHQADHAVARNLLGNLLSAQGRGGEALDHYRAVLERTPNDHATLYNLGTAQWADGWIRDAATSLNRAVELAPDISAYWNALGSVRMDLGQLAEAEACFRRAIAADPLPVEAWNNLGTLKSRQSRSGEALDCFRRALDLAPANAAVHSNYLMELLHQNGPVPEVVAEHRRFGAIQESLAAPLELSLAGRSAPDHRIRVGYVSPDLCDHALVYWLEPLLRGHDRRHFMITCYHTGPRSDHVTERLRGEVDQWRAIGHLSPDQAARLIAEDGIDILVDLAGHTARNGLPIFVRKPAPIQATWLGYPATTGLTRIDYRITDSTSEPEGSCNERYSETLVRLGKGGAFQPPLNAPPPGMLPMAGTGRPRLGSFNRPQKITPAVIALWSRLLAEIPLATLVMVVPGGDRDDTIRATRAPFARHGIAPERIEVRATCAMPAFLEIVRSVDLALDPFPYGGGTTTPLCLWMGVPVIGIYEFAAHSAVTPGFMYPMRLRHLVARDPEHYVRLVHRQLRNPIRLAKIRTRLRECMAIKSQQSGREMAAELEDTYRGWMRKLVTAV